MAEAALCMIRISQQQRKKRAEKKGTPLRKCTNKDYFR